MIDELASRILMSDSIRGMVPELEEDQVQQIQDSFVVAALEVAFVDKNNVFVGKLLGFSSEEAFKIDTKMKVSEAYEISKSYVLGQKIHLPGFQIHYADDGFRVLGPFKIVACKMMDFDHSNNMCTLALDLIRETP